MPLHEINTSVQLWDVIIGHIQTGQCTDRSTTVSICVRHNIEVSAHHDHYSQILVTWDLQFSLKMNYCAPIALLAVIKT